MEKNETALEPEELSAPDFYDLLAYCPASLNEAEKSLLKKALVLSRERGASHPSKSGESYYIHSIDVAKIVASEMGLGYTSVVCALLHDIVNEGKVPVEEVKQMFGEQIGSIVEGMSKISSMQTAKIALNTENYIKLFLSYSDDVRIILIKLADRLHYMRRFTSLSLLNKERLLSETSLLYSPIAHRLGLYNIKTELEELTMKYAEPDTYRSISNKLNEFKQIQDKYIGEFIEPIQKELTEHGFEFEIKSRTKSVFSIWNKMKKQNLDFEQVYDLFAIRIIINSDEKKEKEDCWHIYSIVTNIYKPDPDRMRDWITKAKLNGYRSLHTTVIGPRGKWVEVQIRTRRMDEDAEKGHSAHWKYKESSNEDQSDDWLKRMREILEKPLPGEAAFTGDHKMQLYSDKVFAFTPDGDLKILSNGATVLDFAFEIHSNVGTKCTGGKVNGKIVPMKHELHNGDRVEILTSKNQKPNTDWLNWVATTRSKNKIRRALKDFEYKEASAGKELLSRKLSQLKLTINDEAINKLVAHFKQSTPLDLYQSIGTEKIDISLIKEVFFPSAKPEVEKPAEIIKPAEGLKPEESIEAASSEAIIILNDTTELRDFKLAKCCHPVFGDDIFGFVTIIKGITIHRSDCPNAKQLHHKYDYRIVKTNWGHPGSLTAFLAHLRIIGMDEVGMLSTITDVISKEMNVNIREASIQSKNGKFEGLITVFIKNKRQMDFLFQRLRQIKGVLKVSRIEKEKSL